MTIKKTFGVQVYLPGQSLELQSLVLVPEKSHCGSQHLLQELAHQIEALRLSSYLYLQMIGNLACELTALIIGVVRLKLFVLMD